MGVGISRWWENDRWPRETFPLKQSVLSDVRSSTAGPSEDELTAHHEAGHAIVELAQGGTVVEMWMDRKGNGRCLKRKPEKGSGWQPNADGGERVLAAVTNGLRPSVNARAIFFKTLVGQAAGEIAMRRAAGDSRSDEYHRLRSMDDREKLFAIAEKITGSPTAFGTLLRDVTAEAHRILDRHWDVVEELARELIEWRRLDERAIDAIVGDIDGSQDQMTVRSCESSWRPRPDLDPPWMQEVFAHARAER